MWRTISARRVHSVDYGRDVILCDRFHRGAVTLVADVMEIDGMADVNAWQPMETAPQGVEPLLLALSHPFHSNDVHGYAPWEEIRVVIGWRDVSGYSDDSTRWMCCFMEDGTADTEGYSSQFFMSIEPLAWMPLPALPKLDDAQGERQRSEALPFKVMSRNCDQCLMTPNRIVSGRRAAQIIRKTRAKDCHFICHKSHDIACHGHSVQIMPQLYRIAGRLGAIQEIDPDTLLPVETN